MSETPAKKGMSRRTIIIIVVVLVLLASAGAVYYFFFSDAAKTKKLKKDAKKKLETPAQQEQPKNTPAPAGDAFPLVKGSKGENVLYLQRALNRIIPVGYDKLTEDGSLGDKTYTAVVRWIGTAFYPVSQANWTTILNKSNAQQAPVVPVPTGPIQPQGSEAV